jgi:hypothetical protein
MSHFAKVQDGSVVNVIVAELDFFESFIDDSPGEWIQTSYKTFQGQHLGEDNLPYDGVAIRGNYANVGMIYDKALDVFYWPQPFPSWGFNQEKYRWDPPIPCPGGELAIGTHYEWNEDELVWELMAEIPSE